MKLHWSPRSPYVRKVMVCAHELGLASKIELIRSVVEIVAPNQAVMRDNPLSKIPTLVLDDGRALFDSPVICEYLDGIGGKKLFPANAEERWPALRWLAFGDGLTDALIFWRDERRRQEPSKIHLEAYEKKVSAALDQLEREAADIGKKTFSIGHISLGCALGYIDFRFSDIEWRRGRAKLAAWHEEIAQRPSMQATTPKET